MDNLAHACASIVTTAIVSPRSLKKNPKRMALASVLVANIPDIDFLLNIFGQTFYHFHHRGFTHSFLGLPVMIPLAMFIQQKICSNDPVFDNKQSFIWATSQLLGTHFLLDYLTSYGVMLFYPATLERFAYPIMFIIDPMFWFVAILGSGVIWKYKNLKCRVVQTLGVGVLATMVVWWSLLTFAKLQSESKAFPSLEHHELLSFPGPLSPLLWLVVKNNGQRYDSNLVSYMTKDSAKIIPQKLHEKYFQNRICDNLLGLPQPEAAYKRYEKWATWAICEDVEPHSCYCHSMRYGFNLNSSEPYFGSVQIFETGDIEFIPPDRSAAPSFFDRFWFFDKE